MQFYDAVLHSFSTKGYAQSTPITKRQFQLVMNSLIIQNFNHLKAGERKLFSESLVNEIWQQVENRVKSQHPNNQTPRTLSRTNKSPKSQPQFLQIPAQSLSRTICDAIQILTNRISECSTKLNNLIEQRKQFEAQENFAKGEVLSQKIMTLQNDLKQFEKDLQQLTRPFINAENNFDLKQSVSKRKSSISKQGSIKKNMTLDQNNFVDHQATYFQQKNTLALKFPLQTDSLPQNLTQLDPEQLSDFRRCSLIFLIMLIVLQATVIIIKYSFVNILTFMVGLFVLVQPIFLPSMSKIACFSVVFTVGLDVAWLLLYSPYYLVFQYNTGLKHHMKPYLRYIWFVTVVQLAIKLIYFYFVKKWRDFEVTKRKLEEKEMMEKMNANSPKNNQYHGGFVDNYIPQVRNL